MKKYLSFLLIIAIGLLSCKDKKNAENKTETAQKTEQVLPDQSKDSTEIKKVIMDFYSWYNSNYAKLQDFVLYTGKRPPYKMNWSEVDKMHSFIRSSVPQLGEEFIKNQKLFLQQCDSAFKVDVNDDVPFGFDWDWYTNSQEDPQYLVDEIKKSSHWIFNSAADVATVDIKGMYLDNGKQTENTIIKLGMKKENGNWKIARIGMD